MKSNRSGTLSTLRVFVDAVVQLSAFVCFAYGSNLSEGGGEQKGGGRLLAAYVQFVAVASVDVIVVRVNRCIDVTAERS